MKKRNSVCRCAALLLAAVLLLAACGGSDTTQAATMHLMRTEGEVYVSDDAGKSIEPRENLGLHSGYGVETQAVSCAWINLDDVKLTKMDENSGIAIQKDGKHLEIEVMSGSLFFNVTQPLEADETLDIRTSTMAVGIRGTRGWVEDNDGLSRVYLLEGRVECAAGGHTVLVNAGEMAELTEDGELVVKSFTAQDIPSFVREELGEDEETAPSLSEPEFSWFRKQFDFVDEDTLPSQTKELLYRIMNAVQSENLDEAEALALSMIDMENITGGENEWTDYGQRSFFSEFDGYRVEVFNWDARDEMAKGDRITTLVRIEIRPESGQGCYVDCASMVDDNEQAYTEAGFAIGQCEDYNWTGSFERNADDTGEPVLDISNARDWND